MRIAAHKMARRQLWFRKLAEIENRACHVRVAELVLPVIIRNRGRLTVCCPGVPGTVSFIMSVEIAYCDRRRDMINQMQSSCRRWRGESDRAAQQRNHSKKLPCQDHLRSLLCKIAECNLDLWRGFRSPSLGTGLIAEQFTL